MSCGLSGCGGVVAGSGEVRVVPSPVGEGEVCPSSLLGGEGRSRKVLRPLAFPLPLPLPLPFPIPPPLAILFSRNPLRNVGGPGFSTSRHLIEGYHRYIEGGLKVF